MKKNKFNKNKKFNFTVFTMIGLGILTTNVTLAENKNVQIEEKSINIIKPLESTEEIKEVKKETNSQKPLYVFSEMPIEGYFTYEEYNEWRNKHDPKREKNDLLKGVIVNSKTNSISSDYKELDNYELTKMSNENDLKKLYDHRIYSDLKNMTGFSLFDELSTLENTLFLFLDLNYEKDKIDNYVKNLYSLAKENNKNIIIFPISLLEEDSERIAFNWLKSFSLGKPTAILNLSEEDFNKTFKTIKVSEEVARRLVDGVVSNNLVYSQRFGYYNPLTLMKIKKIKSIEDKPLLVSHDLSSKEELEKFIKQ